MSAEKLLHGLLRAIYRYLLFFLLVAFVTTCCMVLFLTTLTRSIDITLTPENLNMAAKLTFANVLLLSLIFSVIDAVRRKITVERPVKMIVDGAKKITKGDLSTRIKRGTRFLSDDTFGEIIDNFNDMARELEGLEMLRDDFTSSVSHEMKTPLAVIQNYGTLLQSPELTDDERIEYAGGIVESSRQMADMITNILRLNKLENQQIFPTKREFDLGEQLCESLLQFEETWETGNIDIDTDIAPSVVIRADDELLMLVWNNLFSNAFKFTPSGGNVFVGLYDEGEYARIVVKDSGCGMSPEVGEHIFEKFYQGERSHSTRGNGLGLALVKRVIDILHAEISVESAMGIGSTFTVRLKKQ